MQHLVFEIGTMVTGAHKDFAGFIGYGSFKSATDAADYLDDKARIPAAGKRPTRLGKPGGQFDGSLDILAEHGDNRYYIRLDPNSGTIFALDAPPIVPLGAGSELIGNVQMWKINSGELQKLLQIETEDQADLVVSFDFNSGAATGSPIAQAIGKSPHKTAFKVPFYLNLVDRITGAPPWTFDDHRYEPNRGLAEHLSAYHDGHDDDHDHEAHHDGHKILTHGGIHPDHAILHQAGKARTHGGIHPPGVAQFVIVEL